MTFDILWEDGASAINDLDLVKNKSIVKIPKSTSGRTRDLAKNVLERVRELKDKHSMNFIISYEKLEFVPGIVKVGSNAIDQVAVSSRLDNLEKTQEDVMKILKEIQQSQRCTPQTQPVNFLNVPALEVNGAPAPSFSDVAAVIPPKLDNTHRRPRSISSSSKRSRSETEENENENKEKWKDVNRKRKPKVLHGINKFEGKHHAAVTPFDIVIGNTHPDSEKEIIIEVLQSIQTNA